MSACLHLAQTRFSHEPGHQEGAVKQQRVFDKDYTGQRAALSENLAVHCAALREHVSRPAQVRLTGVRVQHSLYIIVTIGSL